MKTKSIRLIRIGLLLIILLASIHYRVRKNALNKVLSEPSRYERMKVFPEPLSLPAQMIDNRDLYNLGYATFSSPTTIDFQSVSDGTWIISTNDSFRLIFCSPYNTQFDLATLEKELEEEQTELQSNFEIVTMGIGEFKSYLRKIRNKSGYKKGFAAVYTFKNAQAKGLLWVGEEENDYSKATACLESTSGNIGIYIHINVQSENSIESIKPILSSFAFSVDSVDSKKSISNLVANVGIKPQRKQNEFNQSIEPIVTTPVD